MTAIEEIQTGERVFEGGPPLRWQRKIGLVKPDRPLTVRRALLGAIVSWVPLLILTSIQFVWFSNEGAKSFFTDFAVHARCLIAIPALIFAEADCLPVLGAIAAHFNVSGLIKSEDKKRYREDVASTARLLNSYWADIATAVLAYTLALVFLLYVPSTILPSWHFNASGNRSAAGWWHVLVSLPILFLLLIGWAWRLILWSRFLFRMSLLDLRLIPSHPDHVGGLKFVSTSLRKFRFVSFALGALVAGTAANRIVHHQAPLMDFQHEAVALAAIIVVIFAGPLTVFVQQLRKAKKLGIFKYGTFAHSLGDQFEAKWLGSRTNVDEPALSAPDFSATTDLYSVAANVYEMRPVPFTLKDLLKPVLPALVPLFVVALFRIPFDTVLQDIIKLLV